MWLNKFKLIHTKYSLTKLTASIVALWAVRISQMEKNLHSKIKNWSMTDNGTNTGKGSCHVSIGYQACLVNNQETRTQIPRKYPNAKNSGSGELM